MQPDLQLGDPCRSIYGTQARYVTADYCVWVSGMTNDIMVSQGVRPPDGTETKLPLPSLTRCQQALERIAADPGKRGYCLT